MLRCLFFLFCLFGCTAISGQQYTGPLQPPTTGYGSWGSSTVDSLNYYNPSDLTDTCHLFFPAGTTSPVPTVFFMAGNGGVSPSYYRPYLRFIVSKGFAVVFVPSPTSQSTVTRYYNMQNGFEYAARQYPSIIDTTRVGFAGHSFGGGACFGIAKNLANEHNWGSNGRFLLPTAQWYSYNISQSELQNYPANTKLLTILYEDDHVCDHRMAIDIFNTISIPDADKDIALARSTIYTAAYPYMADHVAPNTSARFDAMDYYLLFRLTDAMMDFVFNNNPFAQSTALGDGDPEQIELATGLRDLIVTDQPSPSFPESGYGYPCTSGLNPRAGYCASVVREQGPQGGEPLAYVNANRNVLVLRDFPEGNSFTLMNAMGQLVLEGVVASSVNELELGGYAAGVYIVSSNETAHRIVIP